MNLPLGEENVLLSFKKKKIQISKSKKSLENIRSCVGAQQLKSQGCPGCTHPAPAGLGVRIPDPCSPRGSRGSMLSSGTGTLWAISCPTHVMPEKSGGGFAKAVLALFFFFFT